eukprot:scaffold417_cov252-Pinguiococcus_pyrenoidosus.AAC.10
MSDSCHGPCGVLQRSIPGGDVPERAAQDVHDTVKAFYGPGGPVKQQIRHLAEQSSPQLPIGLRVFLRLEVAEPRQQLFQGAVAWHRHQPHIALRVFVCKRPWRARVFVKLAGQIQACLPTLLHLWPSGVDLLASSSQRPQQRAGLGWSSKVEALGPQRRQTLHRSALQGRIVEAVYRFDAEAAFHRPQQRRPGGALVHLDLLAMLRIAFLEHLDGERKHHPRCGASGGGVAARF